VSQFREFCCHNPLCCFSTSVYCLFRYRLSPETFGYTLVCTPYIAFTMALGPTQPPIQWVPGALSLGVKRPGREADHSPPSSAEVKNAWSYTSTPPICLRGVVLSKAQGQLYLTYGDSTKRDMIGGICSTHGKTGKVDIQMCGWKGSWKTVFGKPSGRREVRKRKLQLS
jgi:hypothetical protein